MQPFWENPFGGQPGPHCLNGSTLLLPVVSVGNVGQLAADLLINTLQFGRVARIQDDALLPAVGSRPYAHVEGLATALEVYQQPQPGSGQAAAAVAQQRAPAAPGTQAAFAERLADFIKQSGVKEVLVLGSIEATVRRDSQLAGSQLRCWAPDSGSGGAEGSASGGSSSSPTALLERCRGVAGVAPLEGSFFDDRPLEARLLPPWPLLRALAAAGVPCAALLCFSSEGDNVGDALLMAGAAAAAAGLPTPAAAGSGGGGDAQAAPAQWVPPPAWRYVYGASTAVY